MKELLKKIYLHKMAPNSAGLDRVTELLCQELPFTVHEYPAGSEFNGWVVPKKWGVKKALLRKEGKVIYDGAAHPLGVFGYSQSFIGKIDFEELKKHLSFRQDLPEAIGYHCDLYYKVGKKDWGFSLPYNLYETLEDGEYEVELETIFEEGNMRVCDYFLPGETEETIIFVAHNCHAAQANDDISGVVAGIELVKRLAQKKNKYSYRLIIGPEHFSSIFYLAHLDKKILSTFKCVFYLEMLGNNCDFLLQTSFTADTELDKACQSFLSSYYPTSRFSGFRTIVGNDEAVWEAPGYEKPTVSFSRACLPTGKETICYPEYHTNLDNEDIISEASLEESVRALLGIIFILETNTRMYRQFEGLVALSNPKYDLYIPPGTDPAILTASSEYQLDWHRLMNFLLRYFDGKMSILDVAIKHNLPYDEVYRYICKFKEKGLITFC